MGILVNSSFNVFVIPTQVFVHFFIIIFISMMPSLSHNYYDA